MHWPVPKEATSRRRVAEPDPRVLPADCQLCSLMAPQSASAVLSASPCNFFRDRVCGVMCELAIYLQLSLPALIIR